MNDVGVFNSAVGGGDDAVSGNEVDVSDCPNREPSGTRSLLKVSRGQPPIVNALAFLGTR